MGVSNDPAVPGAETAASPWIWKGTRGRRRRAERRPESRARQRPAKARPPIGMEVPTCQGMEPGHRVE
jgi:hypothetical protein